MKKFYDVATTADGATFLNNYPKFDSAPPTVRFDLSGDLEIADRIRPLDEQAAANMALSLDRERQLKPVLIRIWPTGGRDGKGAKHKQTPRLLCGLHRLEAAKRLGWSHIAAWLVECDDNEARQAEIDENLVRKELTSAERGRLYDEWLRLHGKPAPAAHEGGDGATSERMVYGQPAAGQVIHVEHSEPAGLSGKMVCVDHLSEPTAAEAESGGVVGSVTPPDAEGQKAAAIKHDYERIMRAWARACNEAKDQFFSAVIIPSMVSSGRRQTQPSQVPMTSDPSCSA